MPTENLTQSELSKRLARTTRQIRKLTEQHGMPRNEDGTYPWPEAQDWWVKFKQTEKERRGGTDGGVTELDKARAAKEWALAGMRQLELDQLQGRLVTVDFMERQMEACFSAVRHVLNNTPGKFAPRLVGCDTVGRGQVLLQEIVDEVLQTLIEAEASLPDEDADASEGDEELAESAA